MVEVAAAAPSHVVADVFGWKGVPEADGIPARLDVAWLRLRLRGAGGGAGGVAGACAGADVERVSPNIADAAGGHQHFFRLNLVTSNNQHPPVDILLPAHSGHVASDGDSDVARLTFLVTSLDSKGLFDTFLVHHEDPVIFGSLCPLGEDQLLP